MTHKTKIYIAIAICLWASAFVGIRAGLQSYSPEGLALLRYLIASICMGIIYYCKPMRKPLLLKDKLSLMAIGVLGIGIYNITLNYGELSIDSGIASFIVSQSPILTAIFAVIFLGERIGKYRFFGLLLSIIGVALITCGHMQNIKWDKGILYILCATFAGGAYSILQKPLLKKYSAIDATTFVIWGATLFLLFYYPQLQRDLIHASLRGTLVAVYLGIFPAAVAYIAWSYALARIPASRATSFFYFTPFVATLLGWLCLGEMPNLLAFLGGVIAIAGVWLVNQAYAKH